MIDMFIDELKRVYEESPKSWNRMIIGNQKGMSTSEILQERMFDGSKLWYWIGFTIIRDWVNTHSELELMDLVNKYSNDIGVRVYIVDDILDDSQLKSPIYDVANEFKNYMFIIDKNGDYTGTNELYDSLEKTIMFYLEDGINEKLR